eukprot:6192451-Pleurochrysis_carterae.AAC.2
MASDPTSISADTDADAMACTCERTNPRLRDEGLCCEIVRRKTPCMRVQFQESRATFSFKARASASERHIFGVRCHAFLYLKRAARPQNTK